MDVLLYAGRYSNCGTGNILRCYELGKYLNENTQGCKAVITGNDLGLIKKFFVLYEEPFEYVEEVKKSYDVIVYDSPAYDTQIIAMLKRYTTKLVALDFFDYKEQEFDLIINLYDQNPVERNLFKGQVYEGVQYAIIKNDILHLGQKTVPGNELPRILVTFGGEDPFANTEKVLDKLCDVGAQITVLLGSVNNKSEQIAKKFCACKHIDFVQFDPQIGNRLLHTDILICGGGTTILEGIFIGNPIIALGQNSYENNFIQHIKENINLFSLDDLCFLLTHCSDMVFREQICKTYREFIDGLGKQRITNIIFDRR